MAKQDDWVRITLRLPPELHEQLKERAGAGSLNAEIVEALEYATADYGPRGVADLVVRVYAPDTAMPIEEIRSGVAELLKDEKIPLRSFQLTIVTPERDAQMRKEDAQLQELFRAIDKEE